jgi:hypothetical protein
MQAAWIAGRAACPPVWAAAAPVPLAAAPLPVARVAGGVPGGAARRRRQPLALGGRRRQRRGRAVLGRHHERHAVCCTRFSQARGTRTVWRVRCDIRPAADMCPEHTQARLRVSLRDDVAVQLAAVHVVLRLLRIGSFLILHIRKPARQPHLQWVTVTHHSERHARTAVSATPLRGAMHRETQ